MVCIPCIVIPVVLWVYKKFLEPYLYPFIAPIINYIWPKKAVENVQQTRNQDKRDCNGIYKPETIGTTFGRTTNGPIEVADKKTD
uniref:UPF0729 protein C18orf32 homolog n=1 Tax=Geotrypetes seraphini TaxID=260995 RepID=A0A6P8PQN7_GEOSA|nr:UPF0729 protein C18orf32 homolog [Geotrypetes seraphini]